MSRSQVPRQLLDRQFYEISNLDSVITPALAIYPDIAAHNLARAIEVMGGDANRWRPHVKTAKLKSVIELMVAYRVSHFKCATTLELLTLCLAGAEDVLLAHFPLGANAKRVQNIALEFPRTKISVLVDAVEDMAEWKDGKIGVFVDINPGMNRTGIPITNYNRIRDATGEAMQSGAEFRGLHYYEGQLRESDPVKRATVARRGYKSLIKVIERLERDGIAVGEVVTSGTPTFAAAVGRAGLSGEKRVHRISAGTLIYCDLDSLDQLPEFFSFRPAALVLSRVVSRPRRDVVTCDAGHKSIPTDSGMPNCLALGESGLIPVRSSEEHLSFAVAAGSRVPSKGEILYLVPRHVCPTVNSFDHALFVRNRSIDSVELVSARGHEAPTLELAGVATRGKE